MQSLRNAPQLARAVLLWFVLYIGVSVAAPVVNPRTLESICTGSGGLMLVEKGDPLGNTHVGHALYCPLCISLLTPPTAEVRLELPPLQHFVQETVDALPRVFLTAAPKWARGPPALS